MKFKKPKIIEDWLPFSTKVLTLIALILVSLLGGLLYFAYQPTSSVYGKIVTHEHTSQKIIALTFDDGPNGQATQNVLNILKNENIHATFFLVGANVQYYPVLAKEIVTDGNDVENHSMYHQRELPFEPEVDIERQLDEANSIIFKNTGETPKYFRPPFGFRTPWAIDAARHAGFTVITWNDLTEDYESIGARNIAKNILNAARPGGIIVLHDGDETKHNVDRSEMTTALPRDC